MLGGYMVEDEHPFAHIRRKMVMARIEFMSRLAAFNHDQLQQSLSEDGWSPLHAAYHLYVIDGIALQQMQSVEKEDNPLLMNFIEESLAPVEHVNIEAFSLESVLAGMAARREELFSYLSTLPAASWERHFHLSDTEQRTLYQLVSMLPLHDQQHARQLAMMKARMDI
jgi:DinB superfamily